MWNFVVCDVEQIRPEDKDLKKLDKKNTNQKSLAFSQVNQYLNSNFMLFEAQRTALCVF